jgi:putative tryptophan/tyrosine transport system substrate-binding protein
MRRRELIAALSGAAAWPLAAHAQQPDRMRRIGVLMGAVQTAELGASYLATFLRRLDELGWRDGLNARIEVRWWSGGSEQMRSVVAELLAFSPDVVMVFSNLAVALLKSMAVSVPMVFVGVGDPVGEGVVASLARPGSNITGFAGHDASFGGKWLEVLKETVPRLTRVLAIMHPETPIHQGFWASMRDAAPRFEVQTSSGSVHDAPEIQNAISSFALKENGGFIVFPHAITWAHENLLITLQLRHRLPALFSTSVSIKAGGLVSYGHDFEDSFRKTAEYVDRVLRGESPGNLPVQQPTKFKLAFNLITGKAIGLEIPPTMLLHADEVIE